MFQAADQRRDSDLSQSGQPSKFFAMSSPASGRSVRNLWSVIESPYLSQVALVATALARRDQTADRGAEEQILLSKRGEVLLVYTAYPADTFLPRPRGVSVHACPQKDRTINGFCGAI